MATPRALKSPPISEALVDIRGTATAPPDALEALRREFSVDYPKVEEMRKMRAELRVEMGKLIPPTADDLGSQGFRLFNQDRTAGVQFRPDGFTFNNLNVYMGGDRLLATALRAWDRFREIAQPVVVPRVALRYINRLELPLVQGDEFRKFLIAPPELPEPAPQRVSDFLSRMVAHEGDDIYVVVTQRLTMAAPGNPVIVMIDVDAVYHQELQPTVDAIRPVLDRLREVKNRTFFALLTEETVARYQ